MSASSVARVGDGIGVPDPAQPGQAAQGRQTRLGAGSKRSQPVGLRGIQGAAECGGQQPWSGGEQGDGAYRSGATQPSHSRSGSRDAYQRHNCGEDHPGGCETGQRGEEDQRGPGGTPAAARCAGSQPQHGRRHPGQAAVAEQQTPVPLQQSLGDVGIPDRQRDRDQLAGQTGFRKHRSGQSSGTPAGRQHGSGEQHLDHHAPVENRREGGDGNVLWHCAGRGATQPER